MDISLLLSPTRPNSRSLSSASTASMTPVPTSHPPCSQPQPQPQEHSFQSATSTTISCVTNQASSVGCEALKEQCPSSTAPIPCTYPTYLTFPNPTLPSFSKLTTPLFTQQLHVQPGSNSQFDRPHCSLSSALEGVANSRVDKHSTCKPFRCNYPGCDATFGQKGSLTRHIRSRHEKLRPHSCDICQKSFSALWTLRVHQRNVHLKSKPHKCHLCDKSFGELFNKSKHIAIVHEGKRPFACPICSRAFGYKGDMRKHVLELHQQAGRPFQCIVPSCGVKFARKRYLRRHENLSHKGHPLLANRDRSSSPQLAQGVHGSEGATGRGAVGVQELLYFGNEETEGQEVQTGGSTHSQLTGSSAAPSSFGSSHSALLPQQTY